jgi:hypothetical protein
VSAASGERGCEDVYHGHDTSAPGPQYIITSSGDRTAVVLPIEEYEELLDDAADLALIADRRDEPTLSHEEVLAELARDGLL